jgi:RpiB/LacA/LacB family sugar-phosphate isomerase
MRIIVGSDHAGFALKIKLISFLQNRKYIVEDAGTYSKQRCDYPFIAYKVAQAVSEKKFGRGVLICKSGIGNSIVANRVSGVRAALCYNLRCARLSRQHNDANVLVLGAAFVDEQKAKRILSLWLKTEFSGGRHRRRLNQIRQIEKDIRNARAQED